MPIWSIILLIIVGIVFSWIWFFNLVAGSGGKISNFILILGFVIIIGGIIALIVYLFNTLMIFKLLSYFSISVACVSLLVIGYNVFNTFRWYPIKEFFSGFFEGIGDSLYSFNIKAAFILLCIALVGTVVSSSAVQQWIGVGDIRVKPEGTYCYYVECEDNYFPARVRVEEEIKQSGNKEKTETYFYIEQIFFSKKSQPKFDCDPVDLNKEEYLYTENGDFVSVILLNETAKSPYVKETNNATGIDITFLCIELSAVIICLIPAGKEVFGSKD